MRHPTLRALVLSLVVAGWSAGQDVSADERFRLGLGLLQRGMHEEAGKEFAAFVQAAPRHPSAAEAWYRLGVCRAETKDPAGAVEALKKALARGGDAFALRVECGYRLGAALRETGAPAEAAAAFDRAADAAGPDHYLTAAARYGAGEAWRDAERPKESETAFAAAAAADRSPEGAYAAPALYALGFAALRANRPEEAARRFADAATRAPAHALAAECRYLAGESLLRAGKAAEALPALEAAAAGDGAFAAEARLAVARALTALGRGDDAAAAWRRAASGDAKAPTTLRARFEIARLDHAAGRRREAAREAEALVKDPGLPEDLRASATELLGLALLDLGRAEEAARAFDAALTNERDAERVARLRHARGEARAELGKWEDALGDYRVAAAAKDPAVAGDGAYGEALALHRLGRPEEALVVLRRSATARPEHRLAVDIRFAEAENLFALKKYADAEPVYAAIPAAHPLARKAAFKRAWCAFLRDDAAEAARRFAALVPENAAEADAVAEESLSMLALAEATAGRDAEALAAADRYRARHAQGPHLAQTERAAARVLRRKGDLAGAAERLRAAAAAAPATAAEAPGDRLLEAELLYRRGDFTGAREAYAALSDRSDASGAKALEGLAWCAFELGDDDAAVAAIARGLKHPAGADAAPSLRELLVSVRSRRGDHAGAAAAAREFLARHRDHARAPEVVFALGVAEARAGRPDAARAAFTALGDGAALARKDRLHYETAWLLKKAGDEAGAAAAFERALATTTDEDVAGEARLHLGERKAAEKDFAGARTLFAAVKGRHRPRALYRLGFACSDAGDVDGAAAAFLELAKVDDATLALEGRALAGEFLVRRGSFAEAAEPLRALLKEAPDHARAQAARLALGRAALELGAAPEAASRLEEFLRRVGGKPEGEDRSAAARAWLLLGRAKAALKDPAGAEAAFAKTAALSDGELGAEAEFLTGVSRRDRGDRDGAVEAWLRLSILASHEAWASRALIEAARVYEETDRKDKAKKLYREAATRFPGGDAAKTAAARLKALGE